MGANSNVNIVAKNENVVVSDWLFDKHSNPYTSRHGLRLHEPRYVQWLIAQNGQSNPHNSITL